MGQSTSQQRQAWAKFECKPDAMIVIDFGPDRVRVAPPTAEAWRALARVMRAHAYDVRVEDTDSYNCREVKGGAGRSLHSYGIALDVNWQTNPFSKTPDGRAVRYSQAGTQYARAQDVKLGRADTDMTAAMVADILAIQTREHKRVFEWGGNWTDRKDAMHFELDVTPDELAAGIDESTVKAPSEASPNADEPDERGSLVEAEEGGVAWSSGLTGSMADQVVAIQSALQAKGFPELKIDGVYGRQTRAAVAAFQRASGLPATGVVDDALLEALNLSVAANKGTGVSMKPSLSLEALARAFAGRLASQASTQPAPQPASQDVLANLLAAALGRAAPASMSTGTATVPAPILSPVDRMLGGEALAGKKTALAVISYAVLAILQATSVVGSATPTGQILTTIIAAFGGLGVIGKVDRITQALAVLAAKPPSL